MPTKRTRRTRAIIPGGVAECLLHVWSDGLFPMPPGGEDELIAARYFGEELPGTWDECRDTILEAWIDEYPGTRPSMWWSLDAPEEERRRLGGIGDPIHEHLPAYQASCYLGIPKMFVSGFDEAYFNGRARDIHGKIIRGISHQYKEGDFKGKAIDPNNPPAYESQAEIGRASCRERV